MKDKTGKSSVPYMYGKTARAEEEQRLRGHNVRHNPMTLKFFSPLVEGKKRLLEIACGAGQVGRDVLKHAAPNAYYIGVDRDETQVQFACQEHKGNSNATILQLDVLTEAGQAQLRAQGKFDFIFMRWILVHFPIEKKVPFLAFLMTLLEDDGLLVCEECDNSAVRYQPKKDIEDAELKAQCDAATKVWFRMHDNTVEALGNDLQYTPEKMQSDLKAASIQANIDGHIELVGDYQVTYRTAEEKGLIPKGYRVNVEFFKEKTSINLEDILPPVIACTEDERVELPFLRENIVMFQRQRIK